VLFLFVFAWEGEGKDERVLVKQCRKTWTWDLHSCNQGLIAEVISQKDTVIPRYSELSVSEIEKGPVLSSGEIVELVAATFLHFYYC